MIDRERVMEMFFRPHPQNRRFHDLMTRMDYSITYSAEDNKILRIQSARGLIVYAYDPMSTGLEAFNRFWRAIKDSTKSTLLLGIMRNPNIGTACFLPLPDSTHRPANAT